MQTIAERVATRFQEKIGASISESDFWKLVQSIGWKRNKNYRQIKKRLMRKYSPQEANAISFMMDTLRGRLGKAIREWEGDTGKSLDAYGDSYDDLVHHIIGLGKREYDASVRNPQRVLDRYNKGEYYESFAYAIPSAYDYKNLELGRYIVWAQHDMEPLEDALLNERYQRVHGIIRKVLDALELMSDGKYREFLKTKDEVSVLIKQIADEHNRISQEARRRNENVDLPDLSNPWGVLNLYTDIEDYLT
jgi:hypothetical protein